MRSKLPAAPCAAHIFEQEKSMSIAQPFYTTIPESGTITLPPEFRTAEVMILETPLKNPTPIDYSDCWQTKSLDEIAAEQGGTKNCTNPDEYVGSLAFLWDSDEEIEAFLKKRKDEV
jgi:hypothetical protein